MRAGRERRGQGGGGGGEGRLIDCVRVLMYGPLNRFYFEDDGFGLIFQPVVLACKYKRKREKEGGEGGRRERERGVGEGGRGRADLGGVNADVFADSHRSQDRDYVV